MNAFNDRPPFEGRALHYILDAAGNPVPEPDMLRFALWLEHANRRVGHDFVDDYEVSTVFLGFDHGLWLDKPVLWETMIFYRGDKEDPEGLAGVRERYTSMKDAVEGHEAAVKMVKRRHFRRVANGREDV